MDATTGFIAIDWGTSNRRAWALDGAGRELDRMADDQGILSFEGHGFGEAARQVRARFGDRPMIMAGMIGSNRGWLEAPYLPCPVTIEDLAGGLVDIAGERAWIVPGVRYTDPTRCDVMRGEEAQLLGAVAAGLLGEDAFACHPGTHTKWARIQGGAITSFRTVMTGEIFALLRQHSILAPQLGSPVAVGDAFLAGVDRSLDRPDLIADLFTIRAMGLLQDFAPDDASAYASGLLIGADARIGLDARQDGGPVALIGDTKLTALYAAAIRRAGVDYVEIDGEIAFLSGIRAIMEKMG